jgi:hypothetical protein
MFPGDVQHFDVLHARVAERLCHRLRGARRTSSGGKPAADTLGMRQRSTSVCLQWSSRASRSPSASRTMPFAAMLTLPPPP